MVDADVRVMVVEIEAVLHFLVPHLDPFVDATDQDVRIRLGVGVVDIVVEEAGSCWTVRSMPGTSVPIRRLRGVTAAQAFRYVTQHVVDHLDVLAADQLAESSRTVEIRARVRSLASSSDPFRRF